MNTAELNKQLNSIECASQPMPGRPSKIIEKTINGKLVKAESKWNYGHSGKGYTTLWYVNNIRVAKARLIEIIGSPE